MTLDEVQAKLIFQVKQEWKEIESRLTVIGSEYQGVIFHSDSLIVRLTNAIKYLEKFNTICDEARRQP